MKMINKFLFALPLSIALAAPTYADDAAEVKNELEDVTMDVRKKGKAHKKHHEEIRSLVAQYMLERGDITQAELDQRREARAAVKEEIKALRASGDEEALKTRLAELKEQRAVKREEFKAYLAENEELAEAIAAQRERIKERREERRQRVQEGS